MALYIARILQRSLLIVGAACLGYWTFATAYAHATNARAARELDDLVRRHAAGELPPGRQALPLEDGALLGRVEIARVGVSTVMVEGTRERWLAVAAGHVRGTALPGEDGNVVLAGHRDSFFRGLRRIEKGDVITLTAPGERRRYAVTSMRIVEPSETGVLRSDGQPRLTLITCYPFGYVGQAPKRYVVTARPLAE